METVAPSKLPDDAEIAERVLTIVRGKTQTPISLDSTLDDAGLDSLSMAETVFEIESAFRIRTNDAILNLRTLREVVDYVGNRVRA